MDQNRWLDYGRNGQQAAVREAYEALVDPLVAFLKTEKDDQVIAACREILPVQYRGNKKIADALNPPPPPPPDPDPKGVAPGPAPAAPDADLGF